MRIDPTSNGSARISLQRNPMGIGHYGEDRNLLLPLFALADDSQAQIAAYITRGEVLVAHDGDLLVGHLQILEIEDASVPLQGSVICSRAIKSSSSRPRFVVLRETHACIASSADHSRSFVEPSNSWKTTYPTWTGKPNSGIEALSRGAEKSRNARSFKGISDCPA